MKKLLPLLLLATISIMILASCDPKNTKVDETLKITLTANPLTLNVNAEGVFTVSSDKKAPEDIAVTVNSSNEKIVNIADESKSIVIPKGETRITGKYTGLSVGKAEISITSSSKLDISVDVVTITVDEESSDNPDIITINLNYTTNPSPSDTGKDWCSFSFPSPDAGTDKWQVGGLWVTNRINSNEPGNEFNTCIENYGMSCVGKMDAATGKIHLALIEKDVDISSLDFIENTYYNKEYTPWYWPVTYAENYKSLAGKSGYLVLNFIYSNTDKNIIKGIYPAWIKVSIGNDGAVTAENMAINCGYGDFVTGQIK